MENLDEKIKDAVASLLDEGNAHYCAELLFRQYQDIIPEIRDSIIALLEHDDTQQLKANNCLVVLAIIGDDTVAEYFQKWEAHPKPWREKLYVSPLKYAEEGGWCIEDGKRKKRYYDTCYALEENPSDSMKESVFGGASTDKCPYCGSSYENRLIIDGSDKRLSFLGLNGKIKIKYCSGCLPWAGTIFCKYTENGESEVILHEDGEEYFCEDEDINNHPVYTLSQNPVSPRYCNPFEGCAIGGAPAFIDDAQYAVCPECGKKMMHIAQIGENYTTCGTEYIQICTDCHIAAAFYQQT